MQDIQILLTIHELYMMYVCYVNMFSCVFENSMSKKLALNIKKIIDDSGLSVLGLEKKSGLKLHAIQNILTGRSKKPSAEVLGCTVEELFGEENEEGQSGFVKETDILHPETFKDACLYVFDFYKKHKTPFTNKDFVEIVMQIYLYSIQNEHKTLDDRFAQWFLEKNVPVSPLK
jgi:hypothetical protein